MRKPTLDKTPVPQPPSRDDLIAIIERVPASPVSFKDLRPTEAPGLEREQAFERIAAPAERQPFGRWLLSQNKRTDWVGTLSKGARSDPAFPKEGDPEAVRKRLRDIQAEGDVFEAVDDAETDWMGF